MTCSDCHELKPLLEFPTVYGVPKGPRCRKCRQIRRTSNHARDPRHCLLYAARVRARRKGVACDLTIADVIVPSRCPVFGIALHTGGYNQCDNSPSLDRINPSRGYVKDNIVVISLKANRIKNDATPSELRAVAAWLDTLIAAATAA